MQAELRERLGLAGARPEARAPEQPFGLRHAEFPPVGGHPHSFMVAPDVPSGHPRKGDLRCRPRHSRLPDDHSVVEETTNW